MSIPIPARRRVRLLVRVVAGALSLAVLVGTAVGWAQLRQLDRSTPTAAVIDAPPPAPSAEQNILLVGLDSRTDAMGNPLPAPVLAALNAGGSDSGGDTTDTLIVVHVPAGGGRATAISVPRDSYVDLGQGLGQHKINSAYGRAARAATVQLTSSGGGGRATNGERLSARGPAPSPNDPAVVRAASAAGARATIGAVEDLTGLSISRYAAVNLAGFADMSTAVGGVPICLREAVDDPYSGLALPAGPQRVSGTQALAFVRQRHGLPNGDLDRIARQQVFLAGATERLLSANTLADPAAVARLLGVSSRAITLDDDWDLLAFARQMQGLSSGAVTFRTVPIGRLAMPTGDGAAVEVDPAEVRAFVAAAIATDAGPAPAVTPTPAAAPSTAPALPAALASAVPRRSLTLPSAAPTPARPTPAPTVPTVPTVPTTTPGGSVTASTANSSGETATLPASGPAGSAPVPAPPPALTAAAPGCVF